MNHPLFLCEKPDQAKHIAEVLGGARRTSTHFETDGGRVTWCYGHLLEMAAPDDCDSKYKAWSFADLPIVPTPFRLRPIGKSSAQLNAIGRLLKESARVVIATDPDREGEMIGREVLTHFNYRGQVDRLWLSALDEDSIHTALGRLKSGRDTLSLYHAALARSQADWLVGMNLTRAMTVTRPRENGAFSIGRVQTPTVALVVRREREIAQFKPRDYFELQADVAAANGASVVLSYAPKDEDKRIWDRSKADRIAGALAGAAITLRRETTPKRQSPPKLFSLDGLQKRANKLWKWPVAKTLEVAQALYERHKATTYPRTDCEFLPEEQLPDVSLITANLSELDEFKGLRGQSWTPRKTVFNTSKVSAHHAIIPTRIKPPLAQMSADERLLYLLIARHYLASLLPDYEYLSTKLSTQAAGLDLTATGNTPVKPGWRIAFPQHGTEDKDPTLPNIPDGTAGKIAKATVAGKKTQPPDHYTEGTLIEDMKSIGKFVTDPAKKARLKETTGIGTSATRAAIIERIKTVGYVTAQKDKIRAAPKGMNLIETLERELPALADPGETAVWEETLEAIAEGKANTESFVGHIAARISDYLSVLRPSAAKQHTVGTSTASAATSESTGIKIRGRDLLFTRDPRGAYYTAPGVFAGRIWLEHFGHKLTPLEVQQLVEGRILEVTDCTARDGRRLGARRLRFDAALKPYPKVLFAETPEPAPSCRL